MVEYYAYYAISTGADIAFKIVDWYEKNEACLKSIFDW